MNLWEKDQAGVGHKDLKQPSLRLIWGNGSFSHTGNHLPPVVNIGLFRKLAPFFDEAILQDEPNTSKKSSCCHEDVVWFEKKSVSGFFFDLSLCFVFFENQHQCFSFFFFFSFLSLFVNNSKFPQFVVGFVCLNFFWSDFMVHLILKTNGILSLLVEKGWLLSSV